MLGPFVQQWQARRIGTALGKNISTFITTNAAFLWEVAATHGRRFSTRFEAVMAPIYAELGVAAEIIQRMRKRR